MIDESDIRDIVVRLARPTGSGSHTIERAAILAEGSHCADIEAWIIRQGGEPQTGAAVPRGRGLHADRVQTRAAPAGSAPSLYVLSAQSLG